MGPIVLPYIDLKRKHVMEEVKELFARGEYKECSMRCKQLLSSAKEPVSVCFLLSCLEQTFDPKN